MALDRGRPADKKYRRIYYMLNALTSRSQGMTRQQLMLIMGLSESQDETTRDSRRRMFERDMKATRRAGWKIDYDNDHGYVLRVVDHRLKAGFTSREREQLLLAAERAGLGRLYEDLGAPADGPDELVEDPDLANVQHAIKHRCRVQFIYADKPRDVHPYDVHFRGQRWLFRGREDELSGHKNWYLDRCTDLSMGEIGTADQIPELPELNLDPLLREENPPVEVVIRVERLYLEQAVGLLGSRGHVVVADDDDGSDSASRCDTVEVSFTVTHTEAFLHRLFELDERVMLLGPEQVRDQARAWLDSVIARRSHPVAVPDPDTQADADSESALPRSHQQSKARAIDRSNAKIEATGPGKLLTPELVELLEPLDNPPTLQTVAGALGRDADEIRRHVDAMNDPDHEAQLARQGIPSDAMLIWIDKVGAEPSDDDLVMLDAELIDVIGTEMFDASVLGPLYVAAEQLSVEEPGNKVLADAAAKLQERFLPGFREGSKFGSAVARDLATAIREHRAVRITYARAWEPGVQTRTIHPYAFEATSRGLEVDAEPAEKPGEVRTFLIGNIRDVQVLTERFEIPEDVERRCLDNRATKTVAGFVPKDRRWTIEKWSEQATFEESDTDSFEFEAELLQPYEDRVSLMMLMAGPRARLLGPEDELAGRRAQKLLKLALRI